MVEHPFLYNIGGQTTHLLKIVVVITRSDIFSTTYRV